MKMLHFVVPNSQAFSLVLAIVLAILCDLNKVNGIKQNVVSMSDADMEFLMQSNFLVGIADIVTKREVQTSCTADMEQILSGIKRREIWALKLIDSFGNIPPSFTWGDNFWFEPQIACDTLNTARDVSLSSNYERFNDKSLLNTTSPIPLIFRMVYANISSPYQLELKLQIEQVLHLGLCLPESCSAHEILDSTTTFFGDDKLRFQRMYNVTVEPFDTKVPRNASDILAIPSVPIFIILAAVLLTLCIWAFVRDISKRLEDKSKSETPNDSAIDCFNVAANLKELYSTDACAGFISSIAGLKTIACVWIILLHLIWHPMFTFDNSLLLIIALSDIMSQVIYQGFLYVDLFFITSAILLTFNFLSSEKKIKLIESNSLLSNVGLYLKMAFYRYTRLAPVFLLTTLLSDVAYSILDAITPFFVNPSSDLYCKEAWPLNIFFLNNIKSMNTMCVSWGWYLACEIQFYLIFLAILFVYVKNKRNAKLIFASITIVSLGVSYYCFYTNGITFQFDVVYQTSAQLYAKPWTRMNSYIGGVFMGWLLYKIKDKNIKIKDSLVAIFWFVCFVMFVCSVFVTYFYNTPVWIVSQYQTFGRLIFALFVGSVIVMCYIGYGGRLNQFLSSKCFVHFYKMTFTMYMLAPIIMTVLFGLRRKSTHFDQIPILMDLVAVILVTYVASVFAVIFVELPFVKLSKKFIR